MNKTEVRAKAMYAKVGDIVSIDPVWNRTERRKIPAQTAIRATEQKQSQTGTMFLVGGMQQTSVGPQEFEVWLDAGWFMEYKATDPDPQQELPL